MIKLIFLFFVLFLLNCVPSGDHKLLVLSNPVKTNIVKKTLLNKNKKILEIDVVEIGKKDTFNLTNEMFIWNVKDVEIGDTIFMCRLTTRIKSIHKLRK